MGAPHHVDGRISNPEDRCFLALGGPPRHRGWARLGKLARSEFPSRRFQPEEEEDEENGSSSGDYGISDPEFDKNKDYSSEAKQKWDRWEAVKKLAEDPENWAEWEEGKKLDEEVKELQKLDEKLEEVKKLEEEAPGEMEDDDEEKEGNDEKGGRWGGGQGEGGSPPRGGSNLEPRKSRFWYSRPSELVTASGRGSAN